MFTVNNDPDIFIGVFLVLSEAKYCTDIDVGTGMMSRVKALFVNITRL